MASNLPYINIYKGDFLRSNVSACSIAAQGLWLRVMILMHDSERIGYLCLNGKAMNPRMVAVKCGLSLDEFEPLLAELIEVSAFSTSRENILFSPELVTQEQERAKNAERQKRFKEKQGNGQSNTEVTPEVTEKKQGGNGEIIRPSSSISTSTSIEDTHINAGASFEYPIKELLETFPHLELLPTQIGMITSEVKAADKEAWLATIKTYQANYNPAKNSYLPEKIGNLLSVFRSERKTLAKQNGGKNGISKNGKTTTQSDSGKSTQELASEWGFTIV